MAWHNCIDRRTLIENPHGAARNTEDTRAENVWFHGKRLNLGQKTWPETREKYQRSEFFSPGMTPDRLGRSTSMELAGNRDCIEVGDRRQSNAQLNGIPRPELE